MLRALFHLFLLEYVEKCPRVIYTLLLKTFKETRSILFAVIQLYRYVWFGFLDKHYPHLEIVRRLTVRSAMDTYRCQGVLTILLQIKGQCNVDDVKKKILVSMLQLLFLH